MHRPSEIAHWSAREVDEFWQYQRIRTREFKDEQAKAKRKAKHNTGSRVIHRN